MGEALRAGFVAGTALGPLAPPLREEYIVSGLLTSGVPTLDTELRRVLRPFGFDLTVGGVFCHGTPKVQLKGGGSCELADLLVVVRYENGGFVERNALLLQAKKEGGAPPKGNQLRLYEDWPEFVYSSAAGLKGLKRSVHPKAPGPGAQFVELGTCPSCKKWAAGCPVDGWAADSWRPGTARRPFLNELSDVIRGWSGRRFELPPRARTRGWDRVIEDLLRVTAERAFRVAKRAMGSAGRGDVAHDYAQILREERCWPVQPRPLALYRDLGLSEEAADPSAWLSEVRVPPTLPPDALAGPVDDDDGAVSLLLVEISRGKDSRAVLSDEFT
ncbi:MAG TPA: hypothetical protein VF517_03985 [Thermoleophilaceae bacterium]